MIRDFVYSFDSKPVLELLKQFEMVVPDKYGYIAIVKFETISPDSFMWRILNVNDAVYYLYAEDYVPGIEHVKHVFDQYIGVNKWDFVRASNPKRFEDASAVVSAQVYYEPENSDTMMMFAVDSGYDLVFLARSAEDPKNGLFSDHAPLGFVPN